MSINKNAFIRYKILDSCFRNSGRRYFIDNLIDECNKVLFEINPNYRGISRRQVFDDISFMESSIGWAISLTRHHDGRRVFYRYEDTSFSINNMPLNKLELSQLKEAIDILSQFKGMPQFDWISELIPKLSQGMVAERTGVFMEFESNDFLRGKDFLGQLFNAIKFHTVLEIAYQPFEINKPYEVVLHPYFLKQYNNRWFIFGYNPKTDISDWVMALDRMVEIKEISIPYIQNLRIDWSEYFEDMVGVTKPFESSVLEVTLHFFGRTGHYIETKPVHGSQKARWLSNDVLEVKLGLMLNYELESLILSYSDSVKVVQPSILIESIRNRLEKGWKQY